MVEQESTAKEIWPAFRGIATVARGPESRQAQTVAVESHKACADWGREHEIYTIFHATTTSISTQLLSAQPSWRQEQHPIPMHTYSIPSTVHTVPPNTHQQLQSTPFN